MEQEKINRINALAKKAKEEGLTEEETAERAALRREYIDAVKGSLTRHLDNTYVVDGKGNKRKLRKSGGINRTETNRTKTNKTNRTKENRTTTNGK